MLFRISLVNIQCHRYLRLKPKPGLNVILGDNNTGKTSILRAVRWVAENKLRTTVMKKRGAEHCHTTVTGQHGTVVREQGSTDGNCYKVYSNKDMEAKTTYRAVGTSVPRAVTDALRLLPINFQTTSDPMFLIGMSPEQRYNYLMQQLGLDVFLELGDKVAQFIKDTKQEQKTVEQMILMTKERMAQCDIEQLQKDLELEERTQELQRELEQVRQEIAALEQKQQEAERAHLSIGILKAEIQNTKVSLYMKQGLLQDTLTQAGRCPLCNHKLSVTKIKEMAT